MQFHGVNSTWSKFLEKNRTRFMSSFKNFEIFCKMSKFGFFFRLDGSVFNLCSVCLSSGDEEIFSEGEVGKTPSGGSISTYKDLCSLATDMNKPDLVYKFISLSNHNMMWNSRKVQKRVLQIF